MRRIADILITLWAAIFIYRIFNDTSVFHSLHATSGWKTVVDNCFSISISFLGLFVSSLADSNMPWSSVIIPVTIIFGPIVAYALWYDFEVKSCIGFLAIIASFGSYYISGSYYNLPAMVLSLLMGPIVLFIFLGLLAVALLRD